MKYMLLIYDNPDTRERFFGDEGDALGSDPADPRRAPVAACS
jgi:hypothetical protein